MKTRRIVTTALFAAALVVEVVAFAPPIAPRTYPKVVLFARDEEIQAEMEKANKLRVGELKKKLEELGVNTKVFLEKPEFVKAYAEAIVDGVKPPEKTAKKAETKKEERDPSYRDVVTQKLDPRMMSGKVIDIKSGR